MFCIKRTGIVWSAVVVAMAAIGFSGCNSMSPVQPISSIVENDPNSVLPEDDGTGLGKVVNGKEYVMHTSTINATNTFTGTIELRIYTASATGVLTQTSYHSLGTGRWPVVSFNNKGDVVVFKNINDNLYYRYGKLNASGGVDWRITTDYFFGTGVRCGISSNDNRDFVNVQADGSNGLWIGTGLFTDVYPYLTKKSSSVKYATGSNPSVVLTNLNEVITMNDVPEVVNQGLLVKVPPNPYNPDLAYHSGTMTKGTTYVVNFAVHSRLGSGNSPTVAVKGDIVMECHTDYSPGSVYYRLGTLNRTTRAIVWSNMAAHPQARARIFAGLGLGIQSVGTTLKPILSWPNENADRIEYAVGSVTAFPLTSTSSVRWDFIGPIVSTGSIGGLYDASLSL